MTDYPLVYPDEEQARMVASIAGILAKRFYPDVSRDDIAQEIYLKWATDWKYIQKYVYDENESRGQAMLRRALTNAATSYCQAEKAAARGYDVSDLYYYSKQALRELLPLLGDYDSFTTLSVQSERVGRSNKPAHEGGDAMAFASDLHDAWSRLNQDQRQMLWDTYVEPVSETPYKTLALQWGISDEAMYMRVDRALAALQQLLGGPRPVDRRKVQSNAAAQAQTRGDYGGE